MRGRTGVRDIVVRSFPPEPRQSDGARDVRRCAGGRQQRTPDFPAFAGLTDSAATPGGD
jgi:hypothetical protein